MDFVHVVLQHTLDLYTTSTLVPALTVYTCVCLIIVLLAATAVLDEMETTCRALHAYRVGVVMWRLKQRQAEAAQRAVVGRAISCSPRLNGGHRLAVIRETDDDDCGDAPQAAERIQADCNGNTITTVAVVAAAASNRVQPRSPAQRSHRSEERSPPPGLGEIIEILPPFSLVLPELQRHDCAGFLQTEGNAAMIRIRGALQRILLDTWSLLTAPQQPLAAKYALIRHSIQQLIVVGLNSYLWSGYKILQLLDPLGGAVGPEN